MKSLMAPIKDAGVMLDAHHVFLALLSGDEVVELKTRSLAQS